MTVADGTVYAAFNLPTTTGESGHVYALRPGDGHLLRLSDGVRLRSLHRSAFPYDGTSTPVVLDGALWVTSPDGRLDEWALPG